MLPGIHSSESPFFLFFSRDPLTLSENCFHPQSDSKEMRGLLILESKGYALALVRKISPIAGKCLRVSKKSQDLLPNSKSVTLYTLKAIPCLPRTQNGNLDFLIINFLTPPRLYWNVLLNSTSINANIGDLHLTNPLDILETESIPSNN